MVKKLSRDEERRGSRRLILWGIGVAIILGLGVTLVPYYLSLQDQSLTDPSGERSFQREGVSIAGKTTQPPAGVTDETMGTSGRAREIISTASDDVKLTPSQAEALNRYVSEHPDQRLNNIDFTIAVGTAVPDKQTLNDWPPALADAFPSYREDQFLLVGNRLVIVEKPTRRVIAIIPTG